jgi:hypothetical protein
MCMCSVACTTVSLAASKKRDIGEQEDDDEMMQSGKRKEVRDDTVDGRDARGVVTAFL